MDSKQDLKDEIAKVAYEIYEQKGISGLDKENWQEAERIVLERLSVREPPKATKKPVPPRKKSATRKKKKSREWRSDNLPKTEQHIPTADIDGTNSRMEQARALKRAFPCATTFQS